MARLRTTSQSRTTTRPRIAIGKYVTNLGVLGAAAGAYSTAKRTQSMRPDWRRYVVWAVWASSLVLAISAVAMQDRDEEFEQ